MKLFFTIIVYVIIFVQHGGIYAQSTHLLLFCLSIALCILLKRHLFVMERNRYMFLGSVLILAGGVFSAVCGIDKEWSIHGVIRLVTIFIVYVCLQQMNESDKKFCLYTIPWAGTGIVLIGSIEAGFSFLGRNCFTINPPLLLNNWIAKTGRFAGPFCYPNTMALFLSWELL